MKNTPHINLLNDIGFGKTVLMPGDPLRAKYIAETFLENPVLVNNVRGVQGYTGYYKGVKVSVMASGMGMPSIAIYAQELYTQFGVENIIRVGTAGSISENCNIRDVVAGIGASTNSNFGKQYGLEGTVSATCSPKLLFALKDIVDRDGKECKFGNLYSSDTFYDDAHSSLDWAKAGCLAVEMEAYALYCIAQRLNKNALAICTISDLCYEPFTATTAEERQNSFVNMIYLALETARIMG